MPIKAFIFDLDDTLTDTYGQLVCRAHEEACVAMQKEGLNIPLEQLLSIRLQFAGEFPKQDVNALLMKHFDYTDTRISQAGFDAYYNTDISNIQLFPGTIQLLNELKDRYLLFLVTAGSYRTQKAKVKQLQLEPFFVAIEYVDISQSRSKEAAFQTIMEKHHLKPTEVVVVGDRVHSEISLANQLGLYTVWLQHGEFAHVLPERKEEIPDFIIQDICELSKIVETFEAK